MFELNEIVKAISLYNERLEQIVYIDDRYIITTPLQFKVKYLYCYDKITHEYIYDLILCDESPTDIKYQSRLIYVNSKLYYRLKIPEYNNKSPNTNIILSKISLKEKIKYTI